MDNNTSTKKLAAGALALACVGALAYYVYTGTREGTIGNDLPNGGRAPSVPIREVTPITKEGPKPTQEALDLVKDGRESMKVSYLSPAGEESFDISILVDSNRVIKDSSIVPHAKEGPSLKLQTAFAEAHKSLVVGKKVSELNLKAVGGASLTTAAYLQGLKMLEQVQ